MAIILPICMYTMTDLVQQGLNVVITTKSGDKFEGLLSGSAFSQQNSRITLKMARKLQSATGGQVNGAASREATLVGSSPEYAMNFDLKDMMDMMIADFAVAEATKLANGMHYADPVWFRSG